MCGRPQQLAAFHHFHHQELAAVRNRQQRRLPGLVTQRCQRWAGLVAQLVTAASHMGHHLDARRQPPADWTFGVDLHPALVR
jgi:hypothetical protein